MSATDIGWTDWSWGPVIGCTRKSEGCRHCYAETMAARIANAAAAKLRGGGKLTVVESAYMQVVRWDGGEVGKGKALPRWSGKLELIESKLDEPLRWRKPRRVFVNSMSDLWHESLSMDAIARVYGVMKRCSQHTFQILTKRPERRRSGLTKWRPTFGFGGTPNVWEGTSIENADVLGRLEELRATPAAVRFLSLEPLLGPLLDLDLSGIDWVIVGGESGPGARPMHPDWAREIRDRCQAAGVPFFFKQWGAWQPADASPRSRAVHYAPLDADLPGTTAFMRHSAKKEAGALLDGREWREFPETMSQPS